MCPTLYHRLTGMSQFDRLALIIGACDGMKSRCFLSWFGLFYCSRLTHGYSPLLLQQSETISHDGSALDLV